MNPNMTNLLPPRDLTPAEKKLFRRVVDDLGDRVHSVPVELIVDYVQADSRIRKLREMAETAADVKISLGAYRQMEAAVTQRRQIAGRLFPDEAMGKKEASRRAAGKVSDDWADLLK